MSNPSHPNEPEQPDFAKLFEQLLGGGDPAMAEALKSMGLDRIDPSQMAMIAGQLQAMFSGPSTGDGVDLDLCADVARKTVSAEGDAVVSDKQRRAIEEAGHVAGLWLDEVTSFEAPSGGVKAWSRAEWVAGTMPMWGRLVSPVAQGVTAAITSALKSQLDQLGEHGLPEGMPGMPQLPAGMDISGMLGQMEPMLARMSSSMFGAQIGRAVGLLAGEVLTGTEVGLPLVEDGAVVVLPANIAEFAEGLEIDAAQIELYLAVRETARVRLFHGAGWLGPQLVTAVQAYARDIRIDTEAIEAKVAGIDPTDPKAMQEAIGDSLFTNDPSPAQKAALTRLETLLALVEGWVDHVSDKATSGHLPQAAALGEAVRRRRATGGVSEQLFGQLVGLELRPRRLRDAANLWAALESASDAQTRDAAWAHPDVAPGAEDLDDPLGFVQRTVGSERTELTDDLDAALEAILAGEDARQRGDAAAEEGPSDAGPWPSQTQQKDPDAHPGGDGEHDERRDSDGER
ncbi:zinc-dependent metalloprotease [Mobilicoccus massiliensis]|uniref:zinc-dependent metalloprotease n=1 Tax=Mobilicoccus massiliensis TaxID=1522310 RepID=UPI00069416B7|nr:zinc-dependent metalloprotease [Mobilicoccus massiliensis]